jgi:hypothetical protein
MTFKSAAVCIAAFVGYLSSMKAETNETNHDESGLFVKEFIAKTTLKVNTNIDLSLIDAIPQRQHH